MLFTARVLDLDGRPIAGARVDVWHSDDVGAYDIMMQDRSEPAMRGLFRTDAHGQFWFTSILPKSYPIPNDGPVGELLRAANRPHMRPAHVQRARRGAGLRASDVYAVHRRRRISRCRPGLWREDSLVVPFHEKTGLRMPDGVAAPSPCYAVDYDFVLTRKG